MAGEHSGAHDTRPSTGEHDTQPEAQINVTSASTGPQTDERAGAQTVAQTLEDGLTLLPSTEADQERVHEKLRGYNSRYWKNRKDFSFHIEKDGEIIAGIVAGSTFFTLEVDYLFAAEDWRGKGLGSLLLRTAEERARQEGITRVLLNTYSFQAPKFYPKMGYRLLFTLERCIGPYSQYFYGKDLTASAGAGQARS